jgi:hypothetical protein
MYVKYRGNRFKDCKIRLLLYLSLFTQLGQKPSPCTSCMEQSSCLPGCTHSCTFCNRSCAQHHHSTQNKPLFWICRNTSCTCRSDLKTQQHCNYKHETKKVWDTSTHIVSNGTHDASHIQTQNWTLNSAFSKLQFSGDLCTSIWTVTVRSTVFSEATMSMRLTLWRRSFFLNFCTPCI